MKEANFFGVAVDFFDRKEIKEKIRRVLKEQKEKFLIATINPEILLKAEKDKKYALVLNKFNLKVVDGFGLRVVGFLKKIKIGERFAGVDLAEFVLREAFCRNYRVTFIVEKGGFSEKNDFSNNFRFRQYFFNQSSYQPEIILLKKDIFNKNEKKVCDEIAEKIKDTEILLVGLGAPEQEKFIWQIKRQLPFLKLAMGVGGTFDFWTGRKKRAPLFLRKIGLEWLWRLLIQPNRFLRIWNAVVVFLWKALKQKT